MNSHKSLLLIFIFCLTWVFAGTDGTIRGRVTDEESSMELPGATIYLPELGIGAAADPSGNFIILNIKKRAEFISFLFYNNIKREIFLFF